MRAIAWLGLLVIVSIAGAGLVLSLDHPRSDAARPELTARGHALLGPRLAALRPDLATLSTVGDDLGTNGRAVLSSLRTLDPDGVDAALTAGDGAVPALIAAAASLKAARANLTVGISLQHVPVADAERVTTIDAAIAASAELPSAWAVIARAAAAPTRLLRAMAEHDRLIVAATAAARADRYADGVTQVQKAQAQLVIMGAIRADAGARGLDVSTLSDLLGRVSRFDDALATLYGLLLDSGGDRTSPAAQRALAEVDSAREALPATEDAMVVIVTDLGGADVTPPLLRIERARAAIDAAAGTLD